jgi:glycosyltransferase involved in cell wall biosynthesis
VQLVHGYPPREVAGTEIYAARTSAAMKARGWEVEVIAATRAPGRRHGTVFTEEVDGVPVHRIVNNLPWRPLGQAERDRLVENRIEEILLDALPDVLHVQHLLYLSAHLDPPCATVATLHDAWGWCPRGGTLLREGIAPCPGPSPDACIPCVAQWSQGSRAEHRMARVAGRLGSVVDPDRLHTLWRSLPAPLRGLALQGPVPAPATPEDFEARQAALLAAYRRMDRVMAPSLWLAQAAGAQGLPNVEHLPHGVEAGPKARNPGDFLFLGSLVPHKGPHLVAQAHALARTRNPDLPGLAIVGPPVDPAYVQSLPSQMVEPPIPPSEVPERLARARALVLGSTWPENAPLVILEARAAGCPILAPDIGGIPELLLHGTDGLLYPPGDVVALAQVLEESAGRTWEDVRLPPPLQGHMDQLESLYCQVAGLL